MPQAMQYVVHQIRHSVALSRQRCLGPVRFGLGLGVAVVISLYESMHSSYTQRYSYKYRRSTVHSSIGLLGHDDEESKIASRVHFSSSSLTVRLLGSRSRPSDLLLPAVALGAG